MDSCWPFTIKEIYHSLFYVASAEMKTSYVLCMCFPLNICEFSLHALEKCDNNISVFFF